MNLFDAYYLGNLDAHIVSQSSYHSCRSLVDIQDQNLQEQWQ